MIRGIDPWAAASAAVVADSASVSPFLGRLTYPAVKALSMPNIAQPNFRSYDKAPRLAFYKEAARLMKPGRLVCGPENVSAVPRPSSSCPIYSVFYAIALC